MSSQHKYITYFLFGLLIGIILCLSWNFEPNTIEASNQRQKRHITSNISLETIEPLEKKVRVLCWVMTSPRNHMYAAIHIRRTWGSRCNKLLFMSTANDSTLHTISLPVKEGSEHLWDKTKEAFKYIYENHFDDADWFLKVDDDSFVIMENLRKMLYSHHHETPIYFGCRYKDYTKQGYMSGSGYVLSKAALRKFVKVGLPNPNNCFLGNDYPDDVAMGACLNFIGVFAGDSRDEKKRGTFFPISLDALLFPGKRDTTKHKKYWKSEFYRLKMGSECCSNYPILFHRINAGDMYTYEYLIYHLHPYGVIYNSEPLPTNKIPTNIDIIKAKLERLEKVRKEIFPLNESDEESE